MWRLETGVLRISFAWSIPGCRYELAKANPQVQGWRGEFISVEKLLLPSTSIKESFWPMWLLTARHMCGENCGVSLHQKLIIFILRSRNYSALADWVKGKLKDSCPRFDSIFRLRERWWANQRKCEE
ncbi:uncharacterized protein BDCG_06831 [Blastomyces dermatitidis ER-3]|uniref:Uncharacterized protein n=1 Tax=Ajellomyces dermatitidis (strain ER-3 / ATCC MYA-2586) TaxID=559297 RepID=A0ABP2F5Z7_AJEDR|nr:uncharacterized protein BDCG_06831 [Blastomyces dermatitidis ER-3]EEQ91711.2 hypothetical protein BDCG_06831 [Blastomyces dermatitidis ER-3]EQL31822.1 hypothetical protein BDFG_05876 [Blastomyces dermatitidis ATCC 26199]